MRTIATMVCAILCARPSVQAQACDLLPTEHERVSYQHWVEADTMTRDTLYARAVEWAKGAGQLRSSNQRQGIVIADGMLEVMIPQGMDATRITYTIAISVQEGRCNYTIADFHVADHSTGLDGKRASKNTPLVPWLGSHDTESGHVCIAIDKMARELSTAFTLYATQVRHH